MEKSKSNRLFIMAVLIMTLAFCFVITGCGGNDKGDADQQEEESVGSADSDVGDQTLMDTSTAAHKPIAQKPKEEAKPKPKPKTKPPEPKPDTILTVMYDQGAAFQVEMLTAISTDSNKVGDRFRAKILGPVDKDAPYSIPNGATFEGVVAAINDGKAQGEKASVKLKFTTMVLPQTSPLDAEGLVVTKEGDGVIEAGSEGTSALKGGGVGAVAGGILGSIIGKKGSKTETGVAGAATGAALGGIIGAVLHKDRVELKEGSKFDVMLISDAVKMEIKMPK